MDAFKIQGFDTKSSYDEFLMVLLRQVLPDFRNYVAEKIRLKKKMTWGFIFAGLFFAAQAALVVLWLLGITDPYAEQWGLMAVYPYIIFAPSLLWLILLIGGLRNRGRMHRMKYTAPVSRIGRTVVNFTQYPFADGSLIIDEDGLFPLEHLTCPYLDDADAVQELWDDYKRKTASLPAVLASTNKFAVEIPQELDVEESYLYDSETTLHDLYEEIEQVFSDRDYATIDMGIMQNTDDITRFIASSDYDQKRPGFVNTDIIKDKLEKIQGIKWEQMIGTLAEELPGIVEEEQAESEQPAAASADVSAEIVVPVTEPEEDLPGEEIQEEAGEPAAEGSVAFDASTGETETAEEAESGDLTVEEEAEAAQEPVESPEISTITEAPAELVRTAWSVDEFSDNVIRKVLRDMAKISLLRNHSVKNVVATIEPRLSDIMHYGAYNFYCPYCHEKDIEKLLHQDFNALKEGTTDPVTWNEHARVYLKDWRDDVWKCNLCERETRHPIPVHKLQSSVFMPAYNYLLQENEKERIRIYSSLNVKKIDYRQAYEKERDEIERENRREIDGQILQIKTLRAQVESIGDMVESMEKLMIKINAVAENRLSSVKEYAHSVEHDIISENNAIVQQVRDDVAQLRNQTHATLQKLSYQEKIEDLERDRLQQETLKQLEAIKESAERSEEQTERLIKTAAMMVKPEPDGEEILPVAGALDLKGDRRAEVPDHPSHEIDREIEQDFRNFRDLLGEKSTTVEGRA